MMKSSLVIALVLINAGVGAFVCEAGSSAPAANDPHLSEGRGTVTGTKNVEVILSTDKAKACMEDILDIDVSIWNNGPESVYLFRRMDWGVPGGIALYVQDERGKFVGPWIEFLLPPPSRDDPAMFVLLDAARSYGARLHQKLKNLVPGPGKYTIQVVYHSPFSQDLYDGKLRNLNVLWVEDPKMPSNQVTLEVVP